MHTEADKSEADKPEIATAAKWLPDNPEDQAITDGDNRAWARQAVTLFRMAKARQQITAAIADKAKREALPITERLLCDQIVTAYYTYPGMRREIIDLLNIDNAVDCIRKILREMGVDEQFLTSLEPLAEGQTAQPEDQDEQLELFPKDQTQTETQGVDLDAYLPRLLMAQRDGYNRIRGITHRNSTITTAQVENKPGVKMERISRKGDKASVTLTLEKTDKGYILDAVKKWRVSAKMLMDYAVIKLTEQNNYVGIPKKGKVDLLQFQNAKRIITFSLEEWCKMRGIPQTKDSLDKERQTVIEDCKTLLHSSIEWEDRNKKGIRTHWVGLHPFPYAEVKNSEIKIEIGTKLAAVLLTSPVMPYRAEFLQISNRTPNAYLMATKLAELCNINGHRKAKPSYIVSVSALLDATDYPTKELVLKEHAGRYTEYIINPFLKAMREIEAVSSLKWEFCIAGGKPLTDGMKPEKKIDDFLTAYIKYAFTDDQAFENLQETT